MVTAYRQPYPQPGGGILGTAQPPMGILGMTPRIPWSQNPVVTAIGASLLAGRGTLSGAGPYLAQTLPAAMQANNQYREQTRTAAMKQQEEAARRAQLNEVLKAWPGLTPEQRALFMAQPELFGPYAVESMKPPTPTDDMREYEFAKSQGFTGTFHDYMTQMRKAGGTTVNVGPTGVQYRDPPEGYEYARDAGGNIRLEPDPSTGAMVPRLIPIPGGKPAMEAETKKEIETKQHEQKELYTDVVLTDVGRMKEKIENAPWYLPATGLFGNILKNVGGTPAADVRALAETVRSYIGFDRLQAMREASPAGGALGQITERELAFLQATLGSLEQSQTEEQLLFNLDRLERIYTDVMRKAAAYPNAAEYGFANPAPSSSPAPVYTSPSGVKVYPE